MAIIIGCQNISAQLTIPAGNTYSGVSNRPLGAFYGYDRTLSVYTASQMNITSGSMITGIRYFCQIASTTVNLPVFVYVKNVGFSSYAAGFYNATAVLGSTLVYSGTLPASDFQAGKWVTIPFTTPFQYTGSNLQILVGTDYEVSNADGPATKAFRWSDTSQNQTQYWNSNIAPTFPSNGTVIASKPNIQILFDTPTVAGTLCFDYAADTMLENRTKTFAVSRSGGSTGTVSVDYATSNGTAIAGTDYNATSGTLTWVNGDMAPKTISITTLADFIQDDVETINITLSNPVGTTFVGPSSSVVTVTDVLPPMNGTYTVGTGGNYPSLTNIGGLFQALNNRVDGVSGPITINIISDLPAELGTFQLNEITGGYPVLIQPVGGARTITGTNTFSNLGLLRFNGTDNVTINGSTTGTTASSCLIGGDASLRQLTIQFTAGTFSSSVAVYFQSGTNGSKNNVIKNLNVIGGSSTSSGWGIVLGGNTLGAANTFGTDNDGNRVENCSVKKVIVGIYSGGESTSNQNIGTVITQNDFSATGTDRISKNAVIIINEAQPSVTYNKVNISNTSSTDVVGLAIGSRRAYSLDVASGGITGAMVSNNLITGVVNSETIGYSTAGIVISGTASGQPNIVQNNMVSGVTGQAKSDYHVAGIWVVGAVASVTKLYNNTVSLAGDRGAQTTQSPSYGIALTGLDPSLEMKNNIISNTQIVTGGGLVKSYAFGTLSTTFVNLDSDYNVFYSAGVQDGGFRSGSLFTNLGNSYATLADWQTAVSDDVHSIEVAPVFVSPTDLHLLAGSNPVLQATSGLPIASVTTDIDCNPRSTTNPAIGAQEINVSGYSISAGAGTGGTITPAGNTSVAIGGNQSYAITANCGYAVADVLVDGISQGAITSYTFSNVSVSHTITATYTAQLPTITAAGPTAFCIGGGVVLTSSAATGNIWSTGETTQSITAQASGNYWVAINNGSCNSQQSAPVAITITAPAAAPTITANNPLTFCQGGSVTLTSSVLTGNLWSNGATTRAITVTASGNYSVIYNNGGCDSAPSAITTVTVNPLPAIPTISASGSTTLCTGGNVVLTSSSATGNTWSTGATTQSITVYASGNYTVRVNNGICSSAISDITTVTVNTIPARPTVTVTGATTFCEGGSVVLTSSATAGNLWSNGETTQAITVTVSGVYNVTATVNGCTSTASVNRNITVNPLPATPTITASGATNFCIGGSVTLTSSSATGNTWSTGATTQSITVSASGNYTVTVNNGTCTSTASAVTTVTVTTIPVVPTIIAESVTTFCSGGSVTLTSSSVTGNVWSTGATTPSITVTSSGSYTVEVGNGSCTATSSATTVTVNEAPTLIITNPAPICAPTTVNITAPSITAGSTAGGTLSYWTNAATTIPLANPTAVAVSGTYYIKTTLGSCSDIAPVVVTINPLPASPTITSGSTTTFCAGESVELTSSSATGNVWSTGATTQSITVSTAGNYSVAVTTNGCSSSDSTAITVSVNPAPNNEITQDQGIITATQTTATYQWFMCPNTLIDGATSQTYTPLVVGDYKLVVTLGTCNATSDCITVTELGTKDFDVRNFRLYPNPVTNILNVEYTNAMSEVSVFNMLGQKVLSSNVNANSIQIDMSRLPSATYLVKVSSENVMKTFKVIKE